MKKIILAVFKRKLASKIIEEYESSKYDSKTNNISESIPSHLKKEFKFPKLAKLKAKHFIQSPEIDKIENQKKYKNNDRKTIKKIKRKILRFKQPHQITTNQVESSNRVTFNNVIDSTNRGQDTNDRIQSIYSNKAKQSNVSSKASRLKIIDDTSNEDSCNYITKRFDEESIDANLELITQFALREFQNIQDCNYKISGRKMKVKVDLCGGMETLFGGVPQLDIDLESQLTMGQLIKHIKDNYLKEREELFIQTEKSTTDDSDTVRAGIIVMINDTDWELLETTDYPVQDGDNISFISTLHGG